MTILHDIDHKAQAQGQFLADAADGWQLIRQLEEEWFRQGCTAFQMGLTPTDLWNAHQRAGYKAAQVVAAERTRYWGGSPAKKVEVCDNSLDFDDILSNVRPVARRLTDADFEAIEREQVGQEISTQPYRW